MNFILLYEFFHFYVSTIYVFFIQNIHRVFKIHEKRNNLYHCPRITSMNI